MSETKLEKPEGRVSYHDSVEEMLKRIREDGMSNVFDRYAQQEKIRCGFCLQGLSCQLCSNGPCRINEKTGQDKGVCGIAYGTYTHLSPTPFMTGAPKLVDLLTEKAKDVAGGNIALGDDPIEVANNIEAHIIAKRKGLGLS